jgi:inner membrane protein
MPTPLGHALAGIATGLAAAGDARRDSAALELGWRDRAVRLLWPNAVVFAALGALADIDFLFGSHSSYTHSIGAMALVLGIAWLVSGRRLGMAAGLAYGSHILLDWLGNDSTPPIGVMALWPFSREYYESDLHIFMAVTRRYWLANFWTHNLTAAALEVLIFGPFAATAIWWRLRQRPAIARVQPN